jgi:hypothetical protein
MSGMARSIALVSCIFLALSVVVAGFKDFSITFELSGQQIRRLQSITDLFSGHANVSRVLHELRYPLTPYELQELEAVAGVELEDVGVAWSSYQELSGTIGRTLRYARDLTYKEISDVAWKMKVYVPWVAACTDGDEKRSQRSASFSDDPPGDPYQDRRRPEFYLKFDRDKLPDGRARCGRPAFS